jgi:hypothetical protein
MQRAVVGSRDLAITFQAPRRYRSGPRNIHRRPFSFLAINLVFIMLRHIQARALGWLGAPSQNTVLQQFPKAFGGK